MVRPGRFRAHARQAADLFPALFSNSPSILFRRVGLVIKQVYNAGALSLVIIMVSGFFVGVCWVCRDSAFFPNSMPKIPSAPLPHFLSLKELGPVVTALLFAGRAGTALASEIGSDEGNRSAFGNGDDGDQPVAPGARTEVSRRRDIDANARSRIQRDRTVRRAHGRRQLLGVDQGAFWQQIQTTLELKDVYEGIFKSFVFGVVASLLAVWEGYNAIPTAEGVSRATTRSVVNSAIAVLILDFIITARFI